MPLDPQARALLDQMQAADMPDLTRLEPAVARQGFTRIGPEAPVEEVARVQNRTIPGPAGELAVRIYTPEGRAPFPVLVFFHGGGFVVCDLDSHDPLCRALANGASCT